MTWLKENDKIQKKKESGYMEYYLSENVKLQEGYGNTAIYHFQTKEAYLINSHIGRSLACGAGIPPALADKLKTEQIITYDKNKREQMPFTFDYELFDDKYTYSKCKLVYLEVTDVCNYHCMHCYANTKRDARSFMSLEDVRDYLSQIQKSGPCDIRITGGEPFLNKEICSIIGLVHVMMEPLSRHSIVSNGSFCIDDALLALAKGFELQISIYGVTGEKFSSFTNAPASVYQKVMENLALLSQSEYKEQIVLLFSVNALTYDDINAFTAMAKSFGFRYILNRPASVGRAAQNWDALHLPYEKLVSFSKSQRAKTPYYCYHLCQLHWTSIMVNGDVTPCGFLRDSQYVLGNLKKNSFQAIWHCDAYLAFRKLNAGDVAKCSDCEFKYLCTAGCCGETASYTGNILNPFSGCQIKPYANKDYLHIPEDKLFRIIKNAAGLFDFVEV